MTEREPTDNDAVPSSDGNESDAGCGLITNPEADVGSPDDVQTDATAPDDDPNALSATDPSASSARARVLNAIAAICIGLAMVMFWRGFQIPGHSSGDDFALYIDQGRSLIQGDIGATLERTRYSVDHSGWHSFSPYAYPWGLPLLLAPAIMLTGAVDPTLGIDYAPYKLVISICFAVGLLAYFRIVRRRVHIVSAVLLPAFFALNYWYVTHTDAVLSELPFLMALMLFLAWFDRIRERDELLGPRLFPLIMLGFLGFWAFNTRREGLGVLVGLLAAQAALIWGRTTLDHWRPRAAELARINWKAIATPWLSFFGFVVVGQLMLPSDLLPKYQERQPGVKTGLDHIPDNLRAYRTVLSEQLGLKDAGPNDATLFNSAALGQILLYTVIVLAVVGVLVTIVAYAKRDLAMVGTFIGVMGAVLVAPFHDYRYLMALTPFIMFFAFQGLAIPIRTLLRVPPRWPVLITELALLGFIIGGWGDTTNAYEYRSNWVGAQNGPQVASSLEMFQAVRTQTRGDSIIVYHRARTMNLYSGRASVQGGSIDFIERGGDYYAMYLNADGTPGDYSQYPLTDEEAETRGFVEVWRNDGWVLWLTPTSRAVP